ncbi:MAG: ABC transporter ATP-binding protein [Anaerolineaceae bacterium]|nr:ABC transporter ATP-binding protein [Anaerolineaceae bacterium]
MNAIETKNLSRSFHGRQVLKDVSMTVQEGEIYGFLGPNGSGKTTTIRLLLGLLKPDDGAAKILGHDLLSESDAIRAKCGALLEHHGLYERLSAADNLRYFAKIWHMPKAQTEARIKELLTTLDLWDRRDDLPGEWSRGMKQKLAVARTMLHEPRLIFLDEPTAGMDVATSAALREDFVRLAREKQVTIFLTTHNLYEAEQICTHIGVLHNGVLAASATPEELRVMNETHRYHVVAEKFDAGIQQALLQSELARQIKTENNHLVVDMQPTMKGAQLVNFLVQHGVEIEEVYKDKKSLEQAFLSLVEVKES